MIITALNAFGLFLLSLIVPFMSFMLPVYKIKKMKDLKPSARIFSNILIMAAIASLNYRFLFIYIGVFLVIETLYYYFEKFKPDIEIFDRIFITSSIITGMALLGAIFFVKDPAVLLQADKEFYTGVMKLNSSQIDEILLYMKGNSLFVMFIYVFVCNYLTYFSLKTKTYSNWGMSYKWIVIYIGTFFTTKIIGIENYYLSNILNISKLIYVVYGIKVIYSIFGRRINFKGFNKVMAVLTAAVFPTAVFILGAVRSFNIKINIEKK